MTRDASSLGQSCGPFSVGLVLLLAMSGGASAAEDDFYKGKLIRLVIGGLSR
jgi:hypothetical protein